MTLFTLSSLAAVSLDMTADLVLSLFARLAYLPECGREQLSAVRPSWQRRQRISSRS
jgi:hypothetical protein